MSTRSDYTELEWNTLERAPILVAMAVVATGGTDPLQLFQELAAMHQILEETAAHPPEQQLLRDLMSESTAANESPDTETIEASEARVRAVVCCQQVAAILAARSDPDEAEGFKRWIMLVGQRVAEAAREGTFFGMGGRQISDDEVTMLNELAAALGIRRDVEGG